MFNEEDETNVGSDIEEGNNAINEAQADERAEGVDVAVEFEGESYEDEDEFED
jgi:hypothetical protein